MAKNKLVTACKLLRRVIDLLQNRRNWELLGNFGVESWMTSAAETLQTKNFSKDFELSGSVEQALSTIAEEVAGLLLRRAAFFLDFMVSAGGGTRLPPELEQVQRDLCDLQRDLIAKSANLNTVEISVREGGKQDIKALPRGDWTSCEFSGGQDSRLAIVAAEGKTVEPKALAVLNDLFVFQCCFVEIGFWLNYAKSGGGAFDLECEWRLKSSRSRLTEMIERAEGK